jgi:hypothetical protein
MKKNKLFKVLILSLFTSCGMQPYSEPSAPGYYQFTPNDLSHFYIDKDSLFFTEDFYYKDSILFLLNSQDTISAEVITYVQHWPNVVNEYQPKPLYGTSTINFNELTGFRFFRCQVYKSGHGEHSDKYLEVGISKNNQPYSGYLTMKTDSVTILDSLYHDVYKIELIETTLNIFKSIYFAKKFGFIKVECYDGRKMELNRLYHKGVYFKANSN